MTLPWGFPFECSILRNGQKERPISEELRKSILVYDIDFDKRKEFQKEFERRILLPLGLFLHKYPVLKETLNKERSSGNVTLLNIIQDAFRQNASDLSGIMLTFIHFLDRCKGYFLPLFRKQAHQKIVEGMFSTADAEKKKVIQARKEEIDVKSAALFLAYNSRGNPSADNFDRIKNRTNSICKLVKEYRDRVSAHDDEEKPAIPWEDLDIIINQFKEIVDSLYIVGSFSMSFGAASGPGFAAKETVEILLNGIDFDKRI